MKTNEPIISNESSLQFISSTTSGSLSSGSHVLFRVHTPIRITRITGDVLGDIGSANCAAKIQFNPADPAMSTADISSTLSFKNLDAPTQLAVNASAGLEGFTTVAVIPAMGFGEFYVSVGTIDLNLTTTLPAEKIKWSLQYYVMRGRRSGVLPQSAVTVK